MSHRRSLTALAALSLAVVLAACGDDSHSTMDGTNMSAPAGADFGDADVLFAQSMIPHHEQAIEMADMALDPTVGASAEVLDLAGRIKGAQDPEIEMMSGWLTMWGMPMQMDTSNGHDMSSMDGMMTAEEMETLANTTGTEFDRLWLEMMVQHHEGAIAMATDVKADSTNADVTALADAVIAGQQAEIDEMKALLGA